MPALSYSKFNIELFDFENKILDGRKIHTIRRYRKRLFKIGDTLCHYKNWRTSQVQKICENICLYVADIYMCEDPNNHYFRIYVNNKLLQELNRNILAKNDGFNFYKDFMSYFYKSGLPFHGQIIGWVEGINYD